jgi:hypothetical protein
MRTLAVLFLIAGGAFAQDQPPAQGQFFPPPKISPLPKFFPLPVPPKPLATPGVPNFTIRNLPLQLLGATAAVPSRCAVPLIEMKTPPTNDAIARVVPPKAVTDSIAVAPPVPSCADPVVTK